MWPPARVALCFAATAAWLLLLGLVRLSASSFPFMSKAQLWNWSHILLFSTANPMEQQNIAHLGMSYGYESDFHWGVIHDKWGTSLWFSLSAPVVAQKPMRCAGGKGLPQSVIVRVWFWWFYKLKFIHLTNLILKNMHVRIVSVGICPVFEPSDSF